jgi:hypothetical protein
MSGRPLRGGALSGDLLNTCQQPAVLAAGEAGKYSDFDEGLGRCSAFLDGAGELDAGKMLVTDRFNSQQLGIERHHIESCSPPRRSLQLQLQFTEHLGGGEIAQVRAVALSHAACRRMK